MATTAAGNSDEYKRLIDESLESVFIANKEGKIIYANKGICEMLCYDSSELLGKHYTAFLHPTYKELVESKDADIFAGRTKYTQHECLVIKKNRLEIWVEVLSYLVTWGSTKARVVFLRDISMRKRHQEDLIELNRRLKEYAFITSHKLRHPLTNVLGLARLMEMNDPNDPENKVIIENLLSSANQLNDVILELTVSLTSNNILTGIEFNQEGIMKKASAIMLIDEDLVNNFISKSMITRFDDTLKILDFASARKALEYLKSTTQHPDIILLDITMPIMNGWQFLEQYSKFHMPNTQLYILTSSIDPQDKFKASGYSCVKDFISKPLKSEDLSRIMNKSQLGLFQN